MNGLIKLILAFSVLFSVGTLAAQTETGPIPVEVVQQADGSWQLLRGGQPYFIKGVGSNGMGFIDEAKAFGANSIRLWGHGNAAEVLDAAHERGMTVMVGLWVMQERQGFDYDNAKGVKAQLEGFRQIVRQFKDHPALLMWAVGNEVDLFYDNFKVWNAVNDIAKMIHEEDSNHPTITVTAGLDVAEIQLIKERAPHIDIYGVNTYAYLAGIGKQMRVSGLDRPYIVAEWGPSGHWEVPKVEWGAPIEQTSSEKADAYSYRYEKGVLADPEMCLGSYVFLWGQKQETTHTWYGIFLEDSTTTEVMDILIRDWNGAWPENRAPGISSYTMNGQKMESSLYVKSGDKCVIVAEAQDPDGDDLRYEWELLPESTDIKSGGDAESRPEPVNVKVLSDNNGRMEFRAPVKEGPYRLFVTIYDGKGKAATANFPFFVKREL
jgi:hypothetical protein